MQMFSDKALRGISGATVLLPLHPAPPLPGKSQCNQGPPMRAELLEQKYTTFQLPHFSCTYPHIPNPYFANDIIPNLYFAKELRKILQGVN